MQLHHEDATGGPVIRPITVLTSSPYTKVDESGKPYQTQQRRMSSHVSSGHGHHSDGSFSFLLPLLRTPDGEGEGGWCCDDNGVNLGYGEDADAAIPGATKSTQRGDFCFSMEERSKLNCALSCNYSDDIDFVGALIFIINRRV